MSIDERVTQNQDLIFRLTNKYSKVYQSSGDTQGCFRAELDKLKEFVDEAEGGDNQTFYYFKFHYHKLNSIYYRLCENLERARRENSIALRYAAFENFLSCPDALTAEAITIETQSSVTSSDSNDDNKSENEELINIKEEGQKLINSTINEICSDDFKQKFEEYSNLRPKDMYQFGAHYNLHLYLAKTIDGILSDLKPETNEHLDKIANIEFLLCWINNHHNSIRKSFMEYIIKINERERENIFFGKCISTDDILSAFRKHTLYFHPDKTKEQPDYDLCVKVYELLSEIKVKLLSMNMKSNVTFDDYYKDATDLFMFGEEYYYSCGKMWHKLKLLSPDVIKNIEPSALKMLYKQYFEQAFDKYKNACWIADSLNQHNEMLECRVYMAGCLLLGDRFLEAQLIALSCSKLIKNVSFRSKFKENDHQRVKILTEFIKKRKYYDILNLCSNRLDQTEMTKSESTLGGETSSSLDADNTFKLVSQYIRVNSDIAKLKTDTDVVKHEISTNQIKTKAKRTALVAAAGNLVVQAGKIGLASYGVYTYGLAAVSGIISPIAFILGSIPTLYFMNESLKESKKELNSKKNDLKIRKTLDDIMKRAETAHSNLDYRAFFEILSEKYYETSSIITVNFLKKGGKGEKEDENEAGKMFEVSIEKIKEKLFAFGFRPEGIAYLFILLFEAIMGYSTRTDFYEIGQSDTLLDALAEQLLNAVMYNPCDEKCINLEKKANELDDKLNKLRRRVLFESTYFEKLKNKFRKCRDFFSTNYIIDENLLNESKQFQNCSFTSRLNEIRSIAAVNKFILHVFQNNEIMAKKSLKNVKALLDLEYKYVTKPHLRFEALKDFIWLFTHNHELMDMIYDDGKDNQSKDIDSNELAINFDIHSMNLKEAKYHEAEASKSLPVRRIRKYLDATLKYKDVIKSLKLEDPTKKSGLMTEARIGYARCCLKLAKYKETLKFLHDNQDDPTLNKNWEFWVIGSIAHRKGRFDYEKADEFMREAKNYIRDKNPQVLKEISILENLKNIKSGREYLSILSTTTQPHKSTVFDNILQGHREGEKKTYKILSIDGGGIRGFIPAIWLREIEMELKKPISSLFDMLAGTSTGAIIAAALTLPEKANSRTPLYTTENILNLYINEAKHIFQEYGKYTMLHQKYTDEKRASLFYKYFQNYRLKDSLTDLVVPAINDHNKTSTFKFTSFGAKLHERKNFRYYDVIMSTTAAPTYFQPHRLENFDGGFLDGGLTINNPSEIAYERALKNYGNDIKDQIYLLSLGTGNFVPDPHFPSFSPFYSGRAYWAMALKDFVFSPVEGDVEEKMSTYLSNRYYRWQVLSEEEIPLDSIDDKSINKLIEISRQYIEELKHDDKNSFNKVIEMLDN